MQYQDLLEYLPVAAVVVGVVLLLVAQRDKMLPLIAKFRPKKSEPAHPPGMSPVERFNTFYALRSWCYGREYEAAVESLDNNVLPVLVLSEGDLEPKA